MKVTACFLLATAVSLASSIVNPVLAQVDKSATREIKAYRKDKHRVLRDAKTTPLDPEDLKGFRSLNYFGIDLSYRVRAKFIQTADPTLFAMKTTTDRLPEYRKFGEVHFELEGQPLVLEVYQSPDVSSRPGYEDYLFIPFTDETNGHDTYDIGRYLDFRIPSSENVILDFNKSYNPYCAYSSRYSCPIPPAVNHIQMRIEAGEKKFKQDH